MSESKLTSRSEDLAAFSGAFPSLSNIELLWRADYSVPSLYLEHLPFLFWLVVDMAPDEVLTLGLTDGVAHFAACQVIERQGGAGFCQALCFAPSDMTEEALAQRQAIESHNDRNYANFSTLRDVAETAAHKTVKDGSVDLLILESPPSQKLIEDFDALWLAKLSARGVVLIPGTLNLDQDTRVRDWITAQRDRFEHLEFDHGRGLTVLMVGKTRSQRLQSLARLADSRSNWQHILQFFDRIGQLHALHVDLDLSRRKTAGAEQAASQNRSWAKRLSTEQEALQAAYATLDADAAQFREALCARTAQFHLMQQKFEVGQLRGEQRQARQEEKEEEREGLIDRQSVEIAALRQRLADSRADAAHMRRDHAEETRALTAMIEMQGQALADLRAQIEAAVAADGPRDSERFEEIATLTQALEELLAENTDLTRRRATPDVAPSGSRPHAGAR